MELTSFVVCVCAFASVWRVLCVALACRYGAMMWALGKVVNTPEVMRVYVGSFWDYPIMDVEFKRLFEAEHGDLLHDLASLPRFAAVRKVRESPWQR